MKLLITGGAGFIGSHLILHWLKRYPEDIVINVDKLTYCSDLIYLKPVFSNPHYQFIQADLGNRMLVREILQNKRPDGIIHLAAESHVDNSLNDPEIFVRSNIVGTFNLLEEARELWLRAVPSHTNHCFLHVSTDEVYGALSSDGHFCEHSPYLPNSPYSATKAASDHLVRAYVKSFGLNAVITHCSNNFGPHQHDEKFIPTIIRNAIKKKSIPIYGAGTNIRDWLFVEDHCRGIEVAFKFGSCGETYNFGGKNEWCNIDLAHKICNELNKIFGSGPEEDYSALIRSVKDRPGHDFRYAVDCTKAERELGWSPSSSFDVSLNRTIQWYKEKYR